MTKYRSNYINTLTHRHGCQIHINSDGLKRNDRFTNNVTFEFSWNVTNKIKYKRLGGLCKCLEQSFQEKSKCGTGKGLSLTLVRDLNERALTLLEKDLDIVVHESKEKTEETGLETVELSNGGKSA